MNVNAKVIIAATYRYRAEITYAIKGDKSCTDMTSINVLSSSRRCLIDCKDTQTLTKHRCSQGGWGERGIAIPPPLKRNKQIKRSKILE